MTTLEGYTDAPFTHGGVTHQVFRKGAGPTVIVICEIPGIHPGVLEFADRVVALGCSVALPSLFGTPGKALTPGYAAASLAKGCVSKEFATWATDKTSPATVWCRALARHEHEANGGPGVGVVGMCFTGGFALAMMVDPVVVAPVLAQPSLPFTLTGAHKRDVNLSPEDLATVKARIADEPGLCVLGVRFSDDFMAPADRFARLREELGDGFVGVEIDSSKGNVHGIRRRAHSVLTEDLVDEPGHPTHDALQQVLELFRSRLLAPAS